ncbi:MAG: glycerophosphodiester phosphodiesterase, partial [Clostridia bacterium]|nr:glycerophosphodiester phosphodiesterase [Clostridia bacterium]
MNTNGMEVAPMPLWLIPVVAIIALIYLTHPSLRYQKTARWRGQLFAHRGLHDLDDGIVENTLPAFEAARDAGFGMELDIQFSKDGQVVVFHDDDLNRLCGDGRGVGQLTLQELQVLPLAGHADTHIPTLRQVLDAVDGRTPLLIELKNGPKNRQLCEALVELLKDYRGEYIVESFNPLIVAWFRFNAPEVVRGQLVESMQGYRPAVSAAAGFCMAGLLLNFLARPDFVAYDANAQRFFSPRFQRFMYRTPMAAWTVRDPDLARLVKKRNEICIFET